MQHIDTIFSGIMKHLPRYQFERIVKKYDGDRRVRHLRCWEQFIAMIYAQFSGRKSLRDLEINFNAQYPYLYHLGCRNGIKRSTLADANSSRPIQIFEETFGLVLDKANRNLKKDGASFVQLIDASIVMLNKTRFGWAMGQKGKAGIKLHMVYDLDAAIPVYFEVDTARSSDIIMAKRLTLSKGATYVFDRGYYDFLWWNKIDDEGCRFLTRLKKNSPTRVIKQRQSPNDSILSDNDVKLSDRLSRSRKNPYQKLLREIIVKLDDKKEPIRLITNDFTSSSDDIAELYRKRWQIELFFKWIKQNLKIKTFLGTSENAVKIQIITAMISFLLLRITSQTLTVRISLQLLTRIVGANLMARKTILQLLIPPDPIQYQQNINLFNQLELSYP